MTDSDWYATEYGQRAHRDATCQSIRPVKTAPPITNAEREERDLSPCVHCGSEVNAEDVLKEVLG